MKNRLISALLCVMLLSGIPCPAALSEELTAKTDRAVDFSEITYIGDTVGGIGGLAADALSAEIVAGGNDLSFNLDYDKNTVQIFTFQFYPTDHFSGLGLYVRGNDFYFNRITVGPEQIEPGTWQQIKAIVYVDNRMEIYINGRLFRSMEDTRINEGNAALRFSPVSTTPGGVIGYMHAPHYIAVAADTRPYVYCSITDGTYSRSMLEKVYVDTLVSGAEIELLCVSIDGKLYEEYNSGQAVVNLSTLPAGNHVINVYATNNLGETAQHNITVTVTGSPQAAPVQGTYTGMGPLKINALDSFEALSAVGSGGGVVSGIGGKPAADNSLKLTPAHADTESTPVSFLLYEAGAQQKNCTVTFEVYPVSGIEDVRLYARSADAFLFNAVRIQASALAAERWNRVTVHITPGEKMDVYVNDVFYKRIVDTKTSSMKTAFRIEPFYTAGAADAVIYLDEVQVAEGHSVVPALELERYTLSENRILNYNNACVLDMLNASLYHGTQIEMRDHSGNEITDLLTPIEQGFQLLVYDNDLLTGHYYCGGELLATNPRISCDGGKAVFAVNITNSGSHPDKLAAVLAAYDDAGRLLSVKMSRFNNPGTYVKEVSMDVPEAYSVLRGYIWENIETMELMIYPAQYKKPSGQVETVTDMEVMGTAVLLNNDFEDAQSASVIHEMTVTAKSNAAAIKSEAGNSYLYLDQTSSSDDMHLDTNYTTELNNLVMQADFRFDKWGSDIYPAILRDTVSNTERQDLSVGIISRKNDNTGVLKLSDGTVYEFARGRWYNLAAAFDMKSRTFDFYVDYALVAENVPFSNSRFVTPRFSRIWINGNKNAQLSLDNYRVYESKTPLADISALDSDWVPVMPDGTRAQRLLEGRTAICTASGVVYVDGTKETTGYPVYSEGEWYVSRAAAEKLIGSLPSFYQNVEAIPVKAAAAAVGLHVYEDMENHLIVFSEHKIEPDESLLAAAGTYMKGVMPSAAEIRSDFEKTNEAHPRILATAADFTRIKEDIAADAEFSDWNDTILAEADRYLGEPVSTYHYGTQENILEVVREFKRKMLYWGYAWQITGDRKYPDAAWEELHAVCGFPDWDPDHTIDTGEALFAAAIGYDWMYDAFTAQQRAYIEAGTYRLGIEPIRRAYYGQLHANQRFGVLSGGNFVCDTTNFNGVVNGGMVAAALAFADVYPDACFDAASKAIQSIGYMLPGFEPDGGWIEGANYWDYVTQYLAHMVGALSTACGTDYGLLGYPGVRLTPYYAIYLDSWQGLNNFSDCSGGWSWNAPQFSFFGKYLGEKAFTYTRYNAITNRSRTPSVFDMLWYDSAAKTEKPELALDYSADGLDMVSVRESWDDYNGMNFGAHGGKNNVYHGHYDGGNWVFDILGVRWATDLGPDMATYQGTPMSAVYRGRAQGHNMLVFNPDPQEDFVWESNTPLIRFESTPNAAIAVYDNSEGYSRWCSQVTRGFYIGDNRRSLTVRDEFTVLGPNTVVYWNMHTDAEIEIQGNSAILTQNGKKLRIDFCTNAADFELIAAADEPIEGTFADTSHMESDADKNKLMLKLTAGGACYIEAKLYPDGEPAAESGMRNTPISQWELP